MIVAVEVADLEPSPDLRLCRAADEFPRLRLGRDAPEFHMAVERPVDTVCQPERPAAENVDRARILVSVVIAGRTHDQVGAWVGIEVVHRQARSRFVAAGLAGQTP